MLLRVTLIGVFLVSLCAIGLVLFRPAPEPAPAQVAEAPAPAPPAVLVAARDIPLGSLLRDGDLRWQEWAGPEVPVGFVARDPANPDSAVYLGAVARRGFVVGEPVQAGYLVKPGERGFLAAVLTPGHRAVAVSVDATSAASGLIWPGDRVDVILTQTFDDGTSRPTRKAVGETVLRDVRVLSIDQTFQETATSGGGTLPAELRVPRTVTLEASPADAERIAVAAGLGRLTLALRSLGRTDAEADPEVALATKPSPTWAADVSPALALVPGSRPANPGGGPGGPTILRGSDRPSR